MKLRELRYVMRYDFLDKPEAITRHFGIRPAVFVGAIDVYAVVMLNDPDQAMLSFVKRGAAEEYCYNRERVIFGADNVVEK